MRSLLCACLLLAGCGTLDGARQKARAPESERCQVLSDRQSVAGVVAVVAGSLAAPTGLVAVPVDDRRGEIALAASGAVLAATAAGAAWLGQQTATDWVREGCGQ